MCPLYPFHILILYLCLMLPLLLAVVEAAESLAGWNLGISKSTYNEDGNFTLKLREETSETFNINCDGCDHDPGSSYSLKIHNHEPHIAKLRVGNISQDEEGMVQIDITEYSTSWEMVVNITGETRKHFKISLYIRNIKYELLAVEKILYFKHG